MNATLTISNSTADPENHLIIDLSSPVLMSIQSLNFLVGVPLNIYVIFLLTRAEGLDGSGILTLSQSLSDILLALPAPLFVLCYVANKKLCFVSLIVFFISLCMSSRFLLQCCVSWERYLAVVHPVFFMKYKPVKYRLAISIVIWIFSFACGVVSMLHASRLPYHVFAVIYCLILSEMLFCCISILKVLKRPGPGEREREDGGVSAAKKRAFVTVFVNLMSFVIETITLVVSFAAGTLITVTGFAYAFIITLSLSIIVGFAQPIFFLYQNGKLMCMRRFTE